MAIWANGAAAPSISMSTKVALLTEPVTYTTIGDLFSFGLIAYMAGGLAEDRPAEPEIATGAIGLWWSLDTDELSLWDGSEWVENVGGGGGGTADVPQAIQVACSDETTDLATGTAKATFRMPYDMEVSEVRASVTTAGTGSPITVDINANGVSILSTNITIDSGEKTSVTASNSPVISNSSLSSDDEITIDLDQVGSSISGKGLKVTILGTFSAP